MKQIIFVKEEVKIPETDLVLEKGDKLIVLSEGKLEEGELEDLLDEMTDRNDHAGAAVIKAIYQGKLKEAQKLFKVWEKREIQGGL